MLKSAGLGYAEKTPLIKTTIKGNVEASTNKNNKSNIKSIKFVLPKSSFESTSNSKMNAKKSDITKLLDKNVNINYMSKPQLKKRLSKVSESVKIKRNIN